MGYVGNLENFYQELFDDCDDSMGFGFHDSNYVNIQRLFYYVGTVTDDFKVYEKDNVTRTYVECLIKGKNKDIPYFEVKTKWEDMAQWLMDAYGNWDNLHSEFEINVYSTIFEPRHNTDDPVKFRSDINMKYLGIACYAFVGAKKAHDAKVAAEARRKAYLDGINNEYFGEVGAKFEKELMFERIIGFEGYYGYTYLVFFRDEEGRVYKWSTGKGTYQCWHKTNGRDAYLEYEVGKKYLIKGSVKEHSEYKGVKQTVITRCKVLKDEYENHVFSPKDVVKEDAPVNNVEYEDPFDTLISVMEQSA